MTENYEYLPGIELHGELLLLHPGEEGVVLLVQLQLVVHVPCVVQFFAKIHVCLTKQAT